jgi:hypothetical protein
MNTLSQREIEPRLRCDLKFEVGFQFVKVFKAEMK